MDELSKFLQTQKVIQIAPKSDEPWIANVFMVSENPETIYFIGSQNTRYGKLLSENGTLAFATAWHDESDHVDRKGIQGTGKATFTKSEEDIAKGVDLHNKSYPDFAKRITVDWLNTNESGSGVWVIKPNFIKFWNDELYGQDGSKEFTF